MIRFGDAYITESEIAAIFPSDTTDDEVWIALKSGRMICCEMDMIEAERVMVERGLVPLDGVEPGAMHLLLLEDLAEQGYEHLARDADGMLFAYEQQPVKDENRWTKDAGEVLLIREPVFRHDVLWEDAEPSSVSIMLAEARLDPWAYAN